MEAGRQNHSLHPKMISADEYIEQRLNDQISWYDRKSGTSQLWFKRLRFAEIVAATIIPFLSGFASRFVDQPDRDRCFWRCRCGDRVPPRIAAPSGTLDQLSRHG